MAPLNDAASPNPSPSPSLIHSIASNNPLIISFAVIGALSLVFLVGYAIWYCIQWRRNKLEVTQSHRIYPARKVRKARKGVKRLILKEKARKRKEKGKRRPPPLQLGFVNFDPEHLPIIFFSPSPGCSRSPSIHTNRTSRASSGTSIRLSQYQPQSVSSSSLSPLSPLSPKLPRDIIRKMSNPSQLGFIRVDHTVHRPSSPTDTSTTPSLVTSWCVTPLAEYFVAIMPNECDDTDLGVEKDADVVADGDLDVVFENSDGETGQAREVVPQTESKSGNEEEEVEVEEASIAENDDSWHFKCRGEVQGGDDEFTEDWSYKIPRENVQASDDVDEQRDLLDIVVQSPTAASVPFVNEFGQFVKAHLSVPNLRSKMKRLSSSHRGCELSQPVNGFTEIEGVNDMMDEGMNAGSSKIAATIRKVTSTERTEDTVAVKEMARMTCEPYLKLSITPDEPNNEEMTTKTSAEEQSTPAETTGSTTATRDEVAHSASNSARGAAPTAEVASARASSDTQAEQPTAFYSLAYSSPSTVSSTSQNPTHFPLTPPSGSSVSEPAPTNCLNARQFNNFGLGENIWPTRVLLTFTKGKGTVVASKTTEASTTSTSEVDVATSRSSSGAPASSRFTRITRAKGLFNTSPTSQNKKGDETMFSLSGASASTSTSAAKPSGTISHPVLVFSTAVAIPTYDPAHDHVNDGTWSDNSDIELDLDHSATIAPTNRPKRKRFSFPWSSKESKNADPDIEANKDILQDSDTKTNSTKRSSILSSSRTILGNITNVLANLTRSFSAKLRGGENRRARDADLESGM